MKKEIKIKKLDEDDILEILIEHFQGSEADIEYARGILLGTAGKDLRFVGLFGKENDVDIKNYDLLELDKKTNFNGDHSFLNEHPEFLI